MAAVGRLYWQTGDDLVQMWDSEVGIVGLTSGDPALPSDLQSLGSLHRLGNGNMLIAFRSDTSQQATVTVGPELQTAGLAVHRTTPNPFVDTGVRSTISLSESTGGVYDSMTGLNWLTQTTDADTTPWEWTGYDDAMGRQAGRGDVTGIAAGDAYRFVGAVGLVAPTLVGRWLYRMSQPGDALVRYNLDTDQWQTANYGPPYSAAVIGFLTDGTPVEVKLTSPPDGTVNLYDPAAIPWVDVHTPPSTVPSMGAPSNSVTIAPPEVDLTRMQLTGAGDRTSQVVGNTLVWGASHPFTDYGEPIWSWYQTELPAGVTSKIVDIPLTAFHADSTVIADPYTDPDYYVDNLNDALGLVVVLNDGLTAPPAPGRLCPRDDSGNAHSARRFPPPRSIQGSARRAGSYH